jgi:hypothetical protein
MKKVNTVIACYFSLSEDLHELGLCSGKKGTEFWFWNRKKEFQMDERDAAEYVCFNCTEGMEMGMTKKKAK